MGGIEEVEMFSVAPSNLERADSIPVGHGRVSDCLDIRAMSMSHVIINHVSLRQYQFHYFLCSRMISLHVFFHSTGGTLLDGVGE
jgi:hypothetical protein